jgi:phosphate transport system substrate-binding protein
VLKILLLILLEAVVVYAGAAAYVIAFLSGGNVNMFIALFFAGFTIIAVPIFIFFSKIRKAALKAYMGIAVLLLLIATGSAIYKSLDARIPIIYDAGINLEEFQPFSDNVSRLPHPASISITDDIPVMDGALALYPLYSAFATAIYPKNDYYPADFELYLNSGEADSVEAEYPPHEVHFTNTVQGFEGLMDGRVDVFFMAELSEKQKEQAREAGIELVYTPIGKEAFVFFVNSSNPVENLTVEQLQDIYEGRISSWGELGGSGEIRAFQRNEGSGSQSALERFMAGKKLMEPPIHQYTDAMAGIITEVANYKNYKGAIGFSFRYFATEMVQNNQIKLLKVNGVAPTEENTANGSYPLSSYFYAITRKDNSNPNIPLILNWLQSEEGQYLVKAVGYTPINQIKTEE